jgi:hypothetical protein
MVGQRKQKARKLQILPVSGAPLCQSTAVSRQATLLRLQPILRGSAPLHCLLMTASPPKKTPDWPGKRWWTLNGLGRKEREGAGESEPVLASSSSFELLSSMGCSRAASVPQARNETRIRASKFSILRPTNLRIDGPPNIISLVKNVRRGIDMLTSGDSTFGPGP